jgi:hypothetical protein
MPDIDLKDLAEQIYELRNIDATNLMRKVLRDWEDRVVPSRKAMNILLKYLEVDSPCIRLTEDGLCAGWLRKNQSQLDFLVEPPYFCPFVEKDNKPAKYSSCPGYRKPRD